MLVGLVTNRFWDKTLKTTDPHAKEQAEATTDAVHEALLKLGHRVKIIEVGPSLLEEISSLEPDVIFNIATGYHTKKEQANIAAILELSGVPFTGSGFLAHAIGLGKHLAKMVFQVNGIPTPPFVLVTDEKDLEQKLPQTRRLRFPVMVKPSSEGSSVGISEKSVVKEEDNLAPVVRNVLGEFEPPCIIEEFISGREFTVALLGYPEPSVLPVEEIVFGEEGMYTYAVKSRDSVTPVCPAEISRSLKDKIQDIAKRAFLAVGCRDIGRVDLRMGADQVPYVLEINTLPGLMPNYSEVPRIASIAGLDYTQMVARIMEGALRRKD